MNLKKKLLAVFTAAAMLTSVTAIPVFADDDTAAEGALDEETTLAEIVDDAAIEAEAVDEEASETDGEDVEEDAENAVAALAEDPATSFDGMTETDSETGVITVTMTSDVTLSDGWIISDSDGYILDLNGYTLTLGSYILTYDALTIKDGSTEGTGTITTYNNLILYVNGSGAKVTIDGGTLTNTYQYGYGIHCENEGTVIINDGTISTGCSPIETANYNNPTTVEINGGTLMATYGPALLILGQTTLTINDGEINGGILLRMGQVTVNGGTINATTNADNIDPVSEYWTNTDNPENVWLPDAIFVMGGLDESTKGNSLSMTINGGKISCVNGSGSAIAVYDYGVYKQTMSVTIKDGTFETNTEDGDVYTVLAFADMENTDGTGESYGVYKNTVTTSISGGTFNTTLDTSYLADGCTQDTDTGVVVANPFGDGASTSVAEDGTVTITLNDDVELSSAYSISGSVILDLYGHAITGSVRPLITVPSGASLTVQDTSTEADGSITTTGTYSIYSEGTLAITGGAVTAADYAVYLNTDSTATISGGTLTGGTYGFSAKGTSLSITDGTIYGTQYSINMISSSTVTISGGTITGDSEGIYLTNSTLTISDNAEIIGTKYGIEGRSGTVYVQGGKVTGSTYGIYGNTTGTTAINISSGTVSGGVYVKNSTASLSVTGGCIDGVLKAQNSATISLTGGQYTDNVVDYVASGYVLDPITEESDYFYEVKSGSYSTTISYATTVDESATSGISSSTDSGIVTIASCVINALISDKSITGTATRTDKITNIETGDDYVTMDIEPYLVDSSENEYKIETSGTTAVVQIPLPTGLFADGEEVVVTHEYDDSPNTKTESRTTTASNNTVTVSTTNGFSTWTVGRSAEQASDIYVEFVGTSSSNVFEMYLTSTSGKICRFMSAEFEFTLEKSDDSTVSYSVEPYSNYDATDDSGYTLNMTTAMDSTNNKTIYGFNCDDSTQQSITVQPNTKLKIATITLNGVGDYTFSIDDSYSNMQVQTALVGTADNNIVRTYTLTGDSDTDSTTGTLHTDSDRSGKLSLTHTYMVVQVMFPNKAENQLPEYEAMKVAYSNVESDGAIELGYYDSSSTPTTGYYYKELDTDNGWYGYILRLTVPQGYATTLTFSGDGYRTYRTTVVPVSTFAYVTVWNNAMDSATVVTTGCDVNDSETVTFLAGDIVANNLIDLYDLSAVVSYFGKTELTTYDDISEVSDYIKYDLNRDVRLTPRI